VLNNIKVQYEMNTYSNYSRRRYRIGAPERIPHDLCVEHCDRRFS
jgi:hypothetical protein